MTVRPQVDGQLVQILFREGQDVKKGDVLAAIDPALYQAQLDQAVAKKAQDEAQLANARLDLERYSRLAATNAGTQAAGRHAARHGGAARGAGEVRPGRDRQRAGHARLHQHRRAAVDGRTGMRQVDQGNIVRASDATGLVDDHADPADRGAVQPAAAAAGAGQRGDGQGAAAGRGAWTGTTAHRVDTRHAGGHRQPGRPDHRHGAAEGRISQRRSAALARRSSSMCGCWSRR